MSNSEPDSGGTVFIGCPLSKNSNGSQSPSARKRAAGIVPLVNSHPISALNIKAKPSNGSNPSGPNKASSRATSIVYAFPLVPLSAGSSMPPTAAVVVPPKGSVSSTIKGKTGSIPTGKYITGSTSVKYDVPVLLKLISKLSVAHGVGFTGKLKPA